MLMLQRYLNDVIVMGRKKDITVKVCELSAGRVVLGISAPRDVPIWREEILAEPVKELKPIMLWNNGQSYSDETIGFYDIEPLTKTEAIELHELYVKSSWRHEKPYIMGWSHGLELTGGEPYKVEPLKMMMENTYLFDEDEVAKLTNDQRTKFKKLLERIGFTRFDEVGL